MSDLVTLTHRQTEFEAHTIVAVLKSAGIDAYAFGTANAAWGAALNPIDQGVPIQVRRDDYARARQIIEQNVADSVDIDWDQVDVGEREDELPLTAVGHTPFPAKIAFAVTAVILLLGLIAGVINVWI